MNTTEEKLTYQRRLPNAVHNLPIFPALIPLLAENCLTVSTIFAPSNNANAQSNNCTRSNKYQDVVTYQ